MDKSKKLSKKEILKLDKKRAIIKEITQIVNGNLVNFFVVKIGGVVFCDDDGEYRWLTRKEAEEARKRIKQRVRKIIDELKAV